MKLHVFHMALNFIQDGRVRQKMNEFTKFGLKFNKQRQKPTEPSNGPNFRGQK